MTITFTCSQGMIAPIINSRNSSGQCLLVSLITICKAHLHQFSFFSHSFYCNNLLILFFRYGSPHHSRSQSVKAGVGGWNSSGRSLLGPPPQRARVASMPSTGVEEHYYRLRHFSITGKGVVNRGDSLKSKRSRSNNSVASSNSRWDLILLATNVGYFKKKSLHTYSHISYDISIFSSDILYEKKLMYRSHFEWKNTLSAWGVVVPFAYSHIDSALTGRSATETVL